MASYKQMTKCELENEFKKVQVEYEELKSLNLSLDMSRGKPGFENMDMCNEMFTSVDKETGFKDCSGTDSRNYGGMDGIPEMKKLFAEILELDPAQIIVGGNSSLTMMFDTVAQGMTHGFGDKPWYECENRKFLCPVPGYDRHFAITEYFGFELICVPMTENGPDMEKVEELVKDESVKGIWCVPKYSNPQGFTYSDEVVKRMASLKPAAKDFRIFWDNAYVVHDLYSESDKLLNIYSECEKAGNPDLPIIFTSTSKITFPGAGVAAQGASAKNIEILKSRLKYQTIGPDKINQLRHARMFANLEAVNAHMQKLANNLRPKFEKVLEIMASELSGKEIAQWTEPKGGYFISLDVMNGCAKRVETLCKEAGMILTTVGATYPYGKDPQDSNIRIAPSFPSVENIAKASKLLCTAVKYAALEKLLK
jgi:aspartate/methionine/tyrosine aminotransferase